MLRPLKDSEWRIVDGLMFLEPLFLSASEAWDAHNLSCHGVVQIVNVGSLPALRLTDKGRRMHAAREAARLREADTPTDAAVRAEGGGRG